MPLLTSAPALLAADTAGDPQLITAALLGIATVVLLITWLKTHPFLALIIGSAVLGLVAGLGAEATIDSFTKGVGSTVGSVGLLIALGAMIGGLLADSGGADRVVESVVNRVTGRALPWALAGVAALIGLPLFFEVGVVLLVPVVLLVSRRTDVPLMRIGIPALAGLSVLHGLVPPHPGPLVAIDALGADLGLTLALGLLVAIPTVILAGPVFGSYISRHVHAEAPEALLPASVRTPQVGSSGPAGDLDLGNPSSSAEAAPARSPAGATATAAPPAPAAPAATPGAAGLTATRRPDLWPTVATVLLPVVLMLIRAIGELTLDEGDTTRSVLDQIGEPVVALLAGTILAMFTLGARSGLSREGVSRSVGGALPAIAGILLIVAAGGGFKQTLVDAKVGDVIARAAEGSSLSPLLLGWLIAVGIRLATGSATVATIAASGIVAPLAHTLDKPGVALLALAVGAGSLFFSHVNDAGFWLVKEYFGLTVGQTLKSWSVMETIISVTGLLGVLLLNLLL